MTQWTRDRIRRQLRAAGRYCTMAEWTEQGHTPSPALIVTTYGSWRAAWTDAGYPPIDRRTKILEQLRVAGRYWTASAWDRAGRTPHSRTIRRYWPSWDAAWVEAGIMMPSTLTDWPAHPRWHCISSEYQSLWLARHGGASLSHLAAAYALSREGVRYRLAQIQRVLEGHTHPIRHRLYSPTTIIDLLQRWHTDTGQWPTRHAWTVAHQQPCAATIVRYFGSWRRALEVAAMRMKGPVTERVRALTVTEAAQHWHFSPSTVHRLIQLDAVPAQQLGRQWVIFIRETDISMRARHNESR